MLNKYIYIYISVRSNGLRCEVEGIREGNQLYHITTRGLRNEERLEKNGETCLKTQNSASLQNRHLMADGLFARLDTQGNHPSYELDHILDRN